MKSAREVLISDIENAAADAAAKSYAAAQSAQRASEETDAILASAHAGEAFTKAAEAYRAAAEVLKMARRISGAAAEGVSA